MVISNTSPEDLPRVMALIDQAMTARTEKSYKAWSAIDSHGIAGDIARGLQYKLTGGGDLIGIFSILHSDPLIWRHRDRNDAIYLHRIVIDPRYGGKRLFQRVLDWATVYCRKNQLKYIRMDTWADNEKLIRYYQSFGFKFIENYRTPDSPDLPLQNRNLDVSLLELKLDDHLAAKT